MRILALIATLAPLLAACRAVVAEGSDDLIGKPYVANPLSVPDAKGFDCTTLVEGVLSGGDKEKIQKLRYRDDTQDFFSRNHFMENMWIPNAIKHGFISKISLPGTRRSYFKVNFARWYLDNREVAVKDAEYDRKARAAGQFATSIRFVPRASINAGLLESRLPADSDAVVFFLSCYGRPPPYKWLLDDNIMVTHMGILKDRKTLLHASSDAGKVVEQDFLGYLSAAPARVCGVAFYKINDADGPA